MTTWPSTTAGSGKSDTYSRLSSVPCCFKTTALIVFSGSSRGCCSLNGGGLAALVRQSEIHHGRACHDRRQHHVARGFDLFTRYALGRFTIAAHQRFQQCTVFVLQFLRTVAQA